MTRPAARSRRRFLGPLSPTPRRRLWGEVPLVVLLMLGLAMWTDRTALRGLTTTAPGDLGDPLYFAWQLSWVSHALAVDPAQLWTTNAFSRAPGNLAFTDTVLGYAPLGLVVPPGQAGALAQLNLAVLLSTAFAGIGGYALARALGAGWVGGLVAGVGFEFAPWRLQQVIHVNIISTGGVALSVALLVRGSGWSMRRGWEPERISARWIAAGWLVACWQLTFGFATGIWFAYSLAVTMLLLAAGWVIRGRRRAGLPWSVVTAHGLGGGAFAATGVLLVQPYLRVIENHPQAQRGENWLPLFSPPWQGLLTAPVTNWFWGDRQLGWRQGLTWPPEMILSPGILLIMLAVIGLGFSVWPWRRRLAVATATVLLVVASMGTRFPGGGRWTYLPLYRHLPGWEALRTPGRLMIWVTLGLCVLAAGALARFHTELSLPGRTKGWRAVLLAGAASVIAMVPVVLVVVEGSGSTRHWPVSTSPVKLTSLPGSVLLLPTDDISDYHMMLWSTEGWPVLANGSSGFQPRSTISLRQEALSFPDAVSVAALKKRGIRSVVVVRSRAAGGPWFLAADRSVDGLGIIRYDQGDAVVFDLGPAPAPQDPAGGGSSR